MHEAGEEAGGGKPGWKVKCRVLGVTETNECTQKAAEPEIIELKNKLTGTTELLVLGTFLAAHEASCTVSGTKGKVTGSLSILKANGWGLRVS